MTKKRSLSTQVLAGVLIGIATGLFFGEDVGWMSVPGDAFIGLLQMTVLPYIMLSLIVNIGRLSPDTGKRMVKYGLLFLGLLLLMGLLYLLILPLSFPAWSTGSFYSSEFVQPPAPFDFVKNYIPANPFESMSNNVVPAAVLFSIFVGLGVMRLPGKETLLGPMDVMIAALNQVNKMIVRITPYGVFFISAGVVSKLSWTDLSRLQGYLLVYIVVVLLLTFLVLPYIISVFTPYNPKTVFRITRSTLLTIFTTGKIIVVFPQLIEDIKEIIRSDESNEKMEREVDILMPLAYPFPNLGTLMIFVFVPFAAWFTGHALPFSKTPAFLSTTLLSSFVAPVTGLPFTLHLLNIPGDTFNLFMISTVITDRFRVVLGAFHLITLTLLTVTASAGMLRMKRSKAVRGGLTVFLALALTITGVNLLIRESMKNIPTNKERINTFRLISPVRPSRVLERAAPNPRPRWHGENDLSRIKRRGRLRVGYYRNSMPFAFRNSDSLLVGYGIDLAHQLAADLKVSLEFVPVEPGRLIYGMQHDYYDIIMSDIFLSSRYAEELMLSKPYLEVSLALITPKENNDFDDYQSAAKLDTFNISYFERQEIAEEFLSFLPHGHAWPITDLDQFFHQDPDDSVHYDAHLTSAERASALTIFYPDYKMVNPLPYHIRNSLVFPLNKDDVWRRYIDKWIDYRTGDGTFKRIYDQWILGYEYQREKKTWSILHNVILPRLRHNNDEEKK